MKKLLKILLFAILIISTLSASISRLYIGDLDGQFMAGVDATIEFGPFYIGGDIRTIIRKTVINEDDETVGFLPDRTDYKTFFGIGSDKVKLEYAHTCYHRVISNSDNSLYLSNINPEDTDTISIKFIF